MPGSFTYSGNPASSPRDEVRFLIGDTDATRPVLFDAEVDYLLASQPSALAAATEGARRAAARFASLADLSVDGLSIAYSQRRDAYTALAADLSARESAATPTRNVPTMISLAAPAAPPLRVGMHANTGGDAQAQTGYVAGTATAPGTPTG